MSGYWHDPEFQLKLVGFLCRDKHFLRECAGMLTADDFKPRRQQGPELWIIVQTALEFWRRHGEPVGGMLRVEMQDYAEKSRLGEKQRQTLLDTAQSVVRNHVGVAPEAVAEKVIAYKKERAKAEAVQELLDLQEARQLTDEKWLQICTKGVEQFGRLVHPSTDYFESLEDRISRRYIRHRRTRYPLLFIDPLDEMVRTIAPGHLGLWLAFLKMGKSLALEWTALAYVLQGLNTLYFTLEDPQDEVEDRLDACISSLPIKSLVEVPNMLRQRFARFRSLLRSRLRIIDGTEGGLNVLRMEEIWDRERNRGFTARAVIVDYDDEIRATKKYSGDSARRMELADIYRELRQFAARKEILLWTAAQTHKRAEKKMFVTAGMVAEDISKIRKAFCTLGIGQGDWGDDSRYLYVVAHKFDRQHIGCRIMSDPARGIFYDRDLTFKKLAAATKHQEEEEEQEG